LTGPDYGRHLSSAKVADGIEGEFDIFFHKGPNYQPCRRALLWLPNDEMLTTSESAS
jgi:hypothetical protein